MTGNEAVYKSGDDLKSDDRFGPMKKPKFAFRRRRKETFAVIAKFIIKSI